MRFARISSSKVVSGFWSSGSFLLPPGLMVGGAEPFGEVVCPNATATVKKIETSAPRVHAEYETFFIRLSEFTLTIGTPTPKQKLQRMLGDYGMRPGLSGVLINSPGLPLRLTMIVLGSSRSGVRFFPCAEVYATSADCGSAFKPARRIEANS